MCWQRSRAVLALRPGSGGFQKTSQTLGVVGGDGLECSLLLDVLLVLTPEVCAPRVEVQTFGGMRRVTCL